MTSDFDVSQYLNIFLDEAEEQLQALDEGLIFLEKNHADVDLLNRIFRAAHTLKGSSASMGFEKMAHLTHDMENVLDKLRQGELAVSTHIIDLLLKCLDTLKLLKEQIAAGQEGAVETEELIHQLRAVLEGQALAQEEAAASSEPQELGFQLNDIEQNLVRAAEVKGYRVWHIQVTLVPDCLMKAARAYIVFNNLKDMGEVIKTLPTTDEIEAENFGDSFQLVLITNEDADIIENVIKSVSEIKDVVVHPVSLDQEQQVETAEPELALNDFQNQAKEQVEAVRERKVSRTVRVDVQRLENLMNLVGELVIDRTRLAQVGNGLKNNLQSEEMLETLEEVSVHIGRITSDLQEEIMKARMFPVEQVFNRFPRMVRDLAHKAGKEVDFIVEGRETELDRTVIEEIGDPLIHLLRNAIDHGIEDPAARARAGKSNKGTVKLKAFHQENQIVITVADDGRGMDPGEIKRKAVEKGLISPEEAARLSEREALNLIFYPGFSTKSQVSDVSGRGVGMDIVRSNIEKINGIIDIETTPGQGTVFTIKLPLTLAINRSLLVHIDDRVFAFPLSNVVEIINVAQKEIKYMQRQEVIVVRGEVLPLFWLDTLLDIKHSGDRAQKFPVVIVGVAERRVGIAVDELLGEQEIVIKSLGEFIGQVPGLAGATIMGDGKVALILDVRGLVEGAKRPGAYRYDEIAS